ncbi:ParB-related,ThiF-related cassette, protein C (plasmid) [Deinococcus proteolyticus MRP]|uniref:ParB-related,ThiF-related cassette, protein C n=1 Tax=Deinococcus proteolyticus (strain ATCC 35074 / DSM 20540 / JCM 6276 / NBRC 101906 / NCIMB 13154 / VKM Ac-1939 / CCM 2703 / MRP) TaxID=693977 RepID=F0RQC2_DEIPM|nr:MULTISPECIES: PRTRC system protein C [Deinococcus]ADY27481.1 ParB-related,ThiF-related cassette, protein C [Deinococcus proteolyticus MRP]MCY1703794.1 PRTRC system protein C [Deinococcus sp. SL84]
MTIKPVERKIVFNGQELADLNPTLPVDEVVKMHAINIPELATAIVDAPEYKDGKEVYVAKTRLGTKG